MWILVVLTMLLVILGVSYLYRREKITAVAQRATAAGAKPSRIPRAYGLNVPKSYCVHLGHMWVLDEGRQMARVGMDSFATDLFGKIDRIELIGLNRWVRQGQKLMSVTYGDASVDLLSPVEGVVTSINTRVLHNPDSIATDPYTNGWICVMKAPDSRTNLKNLVQSSMVAPWMKSCLERLNAMTSAEGTMAQDGGTPVNGLLNIVSPDLRRRIVQEFFLT